MKRRALLLLFVLVPLSAPLAAAGFGLFQHGGRGAAQVGAFVARADDPSAVRYNPAGVARLEGLQFQAGLDFQAPKDQLDTAGQSDLAHHVIQFPPALYATWKPEALGVPLTFGFSLDAPFWTITNWDTALFPGRFQTIRQETTLFELRPTLAWAIDERWSLGGSLRYVRGGYETSFATLEIFGFEDLHFVEAETQAASQVDGIGFDLGVQYSASNWGWGAVFGTGVSLDGGGDMDTFPREPISDPAVEAAFNRRFASSAVNMNFELPPTASIGVWWGITESLKLEGDVVWSGWSALDRTSIDTAGDLPFSPCCPAAIQRDRDWKDVLSLRLGAEWKLSPMWALGGGLAFEPSPVPEETLEPGYSQGDTTVVAFGASCNLPGLSFDVGYSFHQSDDRDANIYNYPVPDPGTYSARAQVFSISARWRR
ncbi:MAG: outer membrane protein transport protein [Thermoanaerobaculia bacterium]|nr:outer membrane protein transport protein [Thermoanaerobaculia bacterium]MBP9826453.1 outer membrane protein transport protein [Thermoanaerobaculia bacterium]